MQIYLIRHGQTAGNALRRYIGAPVERGRARFARSRVRS